MCVFSLFSSTAMRVRNKFLSRALKKKFQVFFSFLQSVIIKCSRKMDRKEELLEVYEQAESLFSKLEDKLKAKVIDPPALDELNEILKKILKFDDSELPDEFIDLQGSVQAFHEELEKFLHPVSGPSESLKHDIEDQVKADCFITLWGAVRIGFSWIRKIKHDDDDDEESEKKKKSKKRKEKEPMKETAV